MSNCVAHTLEIFEYENLICNFNDSKKYAVHTGSLKQALNHGLILNKDHKFIKFSQLSRLKPYSDINTELKRKNLETSLKKYFFKVMNNAVFEKTMDNIRNHRNKKLVITDKRKNYLVSRQNYH